MIQWYARKKDKGSQQRILIYNILVLFVLIRSKHLKSELSFLTQRLTSKCLSSKHERREEAAFAVGQSSCTQGHLSDGTTWHSL